MKMHILHSSGFWVVIPYSVAVGYQSFRGPYCLHLQHYMVSQPRRP